MPQPDSIRILSLVAFICFIAIGMKRTVWLSVAYLILILCKLSYYYDYIAVIRGELIFAIVILARLGFQGNFGTKLNLQKNLVHKYLILFIGCVFLSFFLVAWDYQYSWDNSVYIFIKVIILYFIVLLSIKNEKDIFIFIWSLIGIYVFLAYEPLYEFLVGIGGSQHKYGINYISDVGVLSGHVAAANNMNQMIPIAFYLFVSVKNKKLKILASLPLIVFALCLIGTGSRGGVLGFMAFGALLVYFSKKRMKNGVIIVTLSVLLFLTTSINDTAGRIDTDSAWGRFTGLTHGIEMVKRGNILGVGPGCFPFARYRYFHYRMESHNLYGQVLGELGIPGTIAWFFYIRQVFINLIESKKMLKAMSMEKSSMYFLAMALQASLIVRLFIGMASHSLYFFYWYIIAPLSFLIFEEIKKNFKNKTNHH